MTVFKDVSPDIINKLEHFGFKKTATKSPHELLRLEGPCIAILYHSKKLLLQGKQDIISDITKLITSLGYQQEIKIQKNNYDNIIKSTNLKKTQIQIGSDESLKGDTFGGIVVAAVLTETSDEEKLEKIGIKDSKLLTDEKIKQLASTIKNILTPNKISVRNISALQYNEFIQKNKKPKTSATTLLLNNLHKYVQEELDKNNSGKKTKITDKFPGCNVGDIIIERAESQYICVAAASIIARNAALLQIEKISNETNIRIPKGSSHVKETLLKLKKINYPINTIAKIDFKNVKEIFNK